MYCRHIFAAAIVEDSCSVEHISAYDSALITRFLNLLAYLRAVCGVIEIVDMCVLLGFGLDPCGSPLFFSIPRETSECRGYIN